MVHEKISMGLDWYIKWFASIVLIFGAVTTAMNLYPYNMYFQFVGITGWLIVGMLWHDRALIFLNGIAIFVFASGLVNHYYAG